MKWFRSRRKLSSLAQTKKYHLTYFGPFLFVVICFILLANVALYLYFEEHCRRNHVPDRAPETYAAVRKIFIGFLVIEVVTTTAGLGFLAAVTAHRIAGAFIKLENAFNEVKQGNLEHRLTFRSYDRLEELEEAFNSMMEELERRMDSTSTP